MATHFYRFFGVMPAYVEDAGCLGAKLLSYYTHCAVIVLFEPATGVPLVVSDQ